MTERPRFTNPIAEGADPWVLRHDGHYYWCLSDGVSTITVWKSAQLTSLGQRHVVWRAPPDGPYSREVWAPELHRLDGRWYIYVAASDGDNRNHRMIVLESVSDYPTDSYRLVGELYTGDAADLTSDNRWAIDGTVLEHDGKRHLVWSGWPGEQDVQYLYIAPLRNPWTTARPRVRLCENDAHAWEHLEDDRSQRGLNEAPQILRRNGRTFIVYSCGGAWLKSYKLGLLELRDGGDPLDPAHWTKHPQPVFAPTARVAGVGHCSFVKSADGEDWFAYHAKVEARPGWRRAIFVQPFTFSADSIPRFGVPMDWGTCAPVPAGEPAGATIRHVEGFSDRLAAWSYLGSGTYPHRNRGRLRFVADGMAADSLLVRGLDAANVSLRVRVGIESGSGRAGVLVGAAACEEPGAGVRGCFVALDAANDRVTLGSTRGRIVAEAAHEIREGRAYELQVDIHGGRGIIRLDGERILESHEVPGAAGAVGLRAENVRAWFSEFAARTHEAGLIQEGP